jgi:hypothetical protein
MKLFDNLDLAKDWKLDDYYHTARYYYNRGIYSCPTWWANPLNRTWSPNLIYKGVEMLMIAALNAQLALIQGGKSDLGEGYFDSISYYHGLLLMEIINVTKQNLENSVNRNT